MERLERSRWGQLVLSLVVVLAGCVEDAGPEREGIGTRSDRVGSRSTIAAEPAVERPRVGCVTALSGQLRPTGEEIAFFTRRDGFGDYGFRAGLDELRALSGIEPGSVPHARYDRELGVASEGLADLLADSVGAGR